jgi:hypothetical protein
METVALGMHQHWTSAAPTQIGTKVWEFRSCSDTNIPLGLVGCYNIAIGDIFDAGQVYVSSEFDGTRRFRFQLVRKSRKTQLSALFGRRRRPFQSAIDLGGLTLDQLIFRNAEGCDVKLDVPIDYCICEIERNRPK